jgi:hypothetical protein
VREHLSDEQHRAEGRPERPDVIAAFAAKVGNERG